jgi:nitrate reductase NapE component
LKPLLADAAPVSDLLDVFNSYDGSVIFRGLTEGNGNQPAILGAIGWIFTGFGALFVLWGFVLRTQRSAGENKMGEIAKTWIVIALMVGGPFMMRAAMQGADSVYSTSAGSPQNLTTACVKAAYAMPELNQLFDVLRRSALAPGPAPADTAAQRRQALVASANDGSILGYLEAFGVSVWDTAASVGSSAAQSWNGMVRMIAMAAGMGSAMLKCLLIAVSIVPLYLLFLAAGAIVWFMEQLRYFLAVSGTMMLPLFTGMFSLPEGHFNRQAAQSYVMHMLSLALWPVAWAIGHTGTIALYNALVSLIAGTSRVPDIVGVLQWSSITTGAPSEAQVQATEAALGNWFMGNLTGLLSILVGGLGFVVWVLIVSVLGPAFLHKLLATGALFMTQAAGAAGRQAAVAGRMALNVAQSAAMGGVPGLLQAGSGPGERLAGAQAADAIPFAGGFGSGPSGAGSPGPASMQNAARWVDDSGGKNAAPM